LVVKVLVRDAIPNPERLVIGVSLAASAKPYANSHAAVALSFFRRFVRIVVAGQSEATAALDRHAPAASV
jgi:hypothetical protein